MKTKQTRLLVDVDFNARDTIYRNLFEAYLLSALKFRIYVRQLFMYNKKVSWKIIFKTLLQAQKETSSRLSPYLNHSSIRILFLYAFCKILNRKRKSFGTLLKLLENELRKQKLSRNVKRMIRNWPSCSLINLPL
ncbi:hypothetical protein BDC45DRAFT_56436 [Circinella umbellata]|nr:hypothetical protein BDC45DRAFT_56436 [Circinella umbellata]